MQDISCSGNYEELKEATRRLLWIWLRSQVSMFCRWYLGGGYIKVLIWFFTLLFLVLTLIFLSEVFKPADIFVEPISIPTKFGEEKGYTPNVVANRLISNLHKLEEGAGLKLGSLNAQLISQESPRNKFDVTVPHVGLSIQAFIEYLRRDWLALQRTVTGELLHVDTGVTVHDKR